MTGDDLRALSAEAVMDVDGEQQYGIVITRKQRDALADLIDAARDYMTTEDVGDEWREHARLRLLDALQEADR